MIDVNEIYRTVQDRMVKADKPDALGDFPVEDAERIGQSYFCITLVREMLSEYHRQLKDELQVHGSNL